MPESPNCPARAQAAERQTVWFKRDSKPRTEWKRVPTALLVAAPPPLDDREPRHPAVCAGRGLLLSGLPPGPRPPGEDAASARPGLSRPTSLGFGGAHPAGVAQWQCGSLP